MVSLRRVWMKTIRSLLVLIPALGLVAGFILAATGQDGLAGLAWALATLPVVAALLAQIVASLRRGDTGLDIVAALSMGGALLLGEYLAGVVVALMYAGGQYLEAFAEGRAQREMEALLARAPRSAMRYGASDLAEVPIDDVMPGDRLLVRKGEVVPVDGRVASGRALLDLSALTGESLPASRAAGEEVPSGALNAGAPFDLVADRAAAASTYAGIVRLVEAARDSKAPMGRLADRYALFFLAVVVVIAGGAYAWTGDPVRALAVLVTATPCPLILAVPVALIAGVSRAARRGVLVKGGGALESLASIRVAVVDKTGTLTDGRAGLVGIQAFGDFDADEVLRLAASVDLASKHVVASALVSAAHARGLTLTPPVNVEEAPGEGVEGDLDGHRVRVGGIDYVRMTGMPLDEGGDPPPGTLRVAVAVDGHPAGLLLLQDQVRAEAAGALSAWRRAGVARIVLASGDRRDVAERIGSELGVDAVMAELRPEEKVAIIMEERRRGPVMMVGDGVNDAPALAAATLGVSMGARGAAASSEAADAVLMTDRLDRLGEAMAIARRSLAIARQSVLVGIGLSFLAMGLAAIGLLTPVQGALVQEAIDVAVILNALRALADTPPAS